MISKPPSGENFSSSNSQGFFQSIIQKNTSSETPKNSTSTEYNSNGVTSQTSPQLPSLSSNSIIPPSTSSNSSSITIQKNFASAIKAKAKLTKQEIKYKLIQKSKKNNGSDPYELYAKTYKILSTTEQSFNNQQLSSVLEAFEQSIPSTDETLSILSERPDYINYYIESLFSKDKYDLTYDNTNPAILKINYPEFIQSTEHHHKLTELLQTAFNDHGYKISEQHSHLNKPHGVFELQFPHFLNSYAFNELSATLLAPYGSIVEQQSFISPHPNILTAKATRSHYVILALKHDALPPNKFSTTVTNHGVKTDMKISCYLQNPIKHCAYCKSSNHIKNLCCIRPTCSECGQDHRFITCPLKSKEEHMHAFESLPSIVQSNFFKSIRPDTQLPAYIWAYDTSNKSLQNKIFREATPQYSSPTKRPRNRLNDLMDQHGRKPHPRWSDPLARRIAFPSPKITDQPFQIVQTKQGNRKLVPPKERLSPPPSPSSPPIPTTPPLSNPFIVLQESTDQNDVDQNEADQNNTDQIDADQNELDSSDKDYNPDEEDGEHDDEDDNLSYESDESHSPVGSDVEAIDRMDET